MRGVGSKNEDLKKEVKQIGSSFIKKVDLLNTALEVIDKLKTENKQAEQKLEKIRVICEPYRDLPIDEFVKIIQILGEVE